MPQLNYDVATAYDLFISLLVLHDPNRFGLRGAWAAGVRSRWPQAERQTLQRMVDLFALPLAWVYGLPEPRDATAVLSGLRQLDPAERTRVLSVPAGMPSVFEALFQQVSDRGRWTAAEETDLAAIAKETHSPRKPKMLVTELLAVWAEAALFGEQIVTALEIYYDSFFAEEEKRIRPALETADARARDLAGRLSQPALLEALTEGLRFEEALDAAELVLAPSFWTPLLIMQPISAAQTLFVYGGRPADASLVPGELVPDALHQALKALADPTRLRILRYLAAEPLGPTELARRLRLRPPTVVHHLDVLRLARLVYLTLRGQEKNKNLYAVRKEAISATWTALEAFLTEGETGDEAEETAV